MFNKQSTNLKSNEIAILSRQPLLNSRVFLASFQGEQKRANTKVVGTGQLQTHENASLNKVVACLPLTGRGKNAGADPAQLMRLRNTTMARLSHHFCEITNERAKIAQYNT